MAWEKLKLLGAGKYGSVYLAAEKEKNSPRAVAVKSAAINSISALQVERDMLQQLRGYPYIIQAFGYDVSFEDGNLVHNLLLEFAGFGNLTDVINNYSGKMPESVVALYSYMILKGLATLHKKDIVHGDIKPENILALKLLPFESGDNIYFLKIADFGGCKKVCDSFPRIFTLIYASPELVIRSLQEKPSDIWAFGCTVINMITGRSLWNYSCNHLTQTELLKKIIYEGPEIPECLSENGIQFLKRCFEKNYSKRWTADELLNHPFIIENIKSSEIGTLLHQEKIEAAKVLDMPWMSTQDLFSNSFPDNSSPDSGGCIPFKRFVLGLSKNCFLPQ